MIVEFIMMVRMLAQVGPTRNPYTDPRFKRRTSTSTHATMHRLVP